VAADGDGDADDPQAAAATASAAIAAIARAARRTDRRPEGGMRGSASMTRA
jgi:hypothetical protein